MAFEIKCVKKQSKTSETLIVPLLKKGKIGGIALDIDKKSGGFLKRALRVNPAFEGDNGQSLALSLPAGCGFERAVFVGLGDTGKLDELACEKAGGKLYVSLKSGKPEHVSMSAPDLGKNKLDSALALAHILNGLRLSAYDFDTYISADKKKNTLKRIDYVGADDRDAQKHFKALDIVTSGVFTARNLVNEPPNELYPDSFAKRISKLLKPLGVDVEIIDEKKMEKLGMGAALAVGKGSERQPRMVIMRYNGGLAALGKKGTNKTAEDGPLVFVGKGVTFDTGGISIKPGAGMDEMKMDMGGAAAVVGLMHTLAARKAKANVVAIVGLAENMPSHNAYRPGDIIKSYSGKTIEVLNTDAEGRLVLADALGYVQDLYSKPKFIIDLATLTGAMMVALGHEYCGSFVNDDKLWSAMEKASGASGEKLWRMPLD